MSTLDELTKKAYEKYKRLPNGKPIVRENIENDAFPIVVLDVLYSEEKKISKNCTINELEKYIVAPPDGGIDIVVEHEDGDDYSYDFIQVKNSELSEVEIKQCFSYMKDTIEEYLKKPKAVAANLAEVLAETNFDKTFKNNVTYIVVHRGETVYIELKKNQKIITGTDLEVLIESKTGQAPKVVREEFESDCFNNFILYDQTSNPGEEAILCNICGYDLAVLANKYFNTTLGKNILFGQNLRESLVKSKTYEGMKKTINKEPEKFWFYNNGITVVTEDYNTEQSKENEQVEKFILEKFSIINGAQTTSALGQFLREAKIEKDDKAIDQLKKVYVLTRILKVNDPTFQSNIAIYNNTQNPITTRDMASNRPEQLKLYSWLIEGDEPNIYVEIRRGSKTPDSISLQKHQKTTNYELAQLAFSGFLSKPYTAKNKKNTMFDTDYSQEDYLINEYYHQVFHYATDPNCKSEGILFNKTKEDINELLFVQYMYKQSKKYLRGVYKSRIVDAQEKIEKEHDENKKEKIMNGIAGYEVLNSINNICMFYCVTLYYGYKSEFYKVDENKKFKYDEFYADKEFREELTKKFTTNFLEPTIKIIKKLSETTGNLNNWIRSSKSEALFLDDLEEALQTDISLKEKYEEFVNQYKEDL